ncbi:SapB/AmfS family lanthipeptide [Actinocrinis puniceicyclus]|uniref:SapB/AmfS family lanthipeptide n=1 Tax=Actinocrinis puniceicyclus TaxID=977794 RepID=A0A8J8BDG3_9ACTN|nr:SapB/AmfS family lanthipeptide [Actinocrinis puniceicyclus]MBS2964116.1 SapB/AmfS family lanthipeptide [Actinocrinis puniceicyclus]
MAILDLQGMEAPVTENHGGASTVSLLSCISTTSVILCV